MTIRATRRISDNDHLLRQQTVTNDSFLTVILAYVLHLKEDALEDEFGIREVQSPFRQRSLALDWIESDTHGLL